MFDRNASSPHVTHKPIGPRTEAWNKLHGSTTGKLSLEHLVEGVIAFAEDSYEFANSLDHEGDTLPAGITTQEIDIRTTRHAELIQLVTSRIFLAILNQDNTAKAAWFKGLAALLECSDQLKG